ncbi:CAP domain-containing protein [Oxalobacteraceae bacterium R-40]|uniref:CAP domain-containing protein n=1 Tax=Keguizhuia sedimenti TaxID=3064264 RepID=A0ABU1BKA4_9BURK|nr:CAP domain-containing protein [Oxalobacteraceae bacterium R-40]
MSEIRRLFPGIAAGLFSILLTACGGGGGGDDNADANFTQSGTDQELLVQEPNAPQFTGNTATDGFNWFNFRRQQLGLPVLARSSIVDAAAQGHSDYQRLNDVITHEQTPGKPGFTGATLADRLQAAGYDFRSPYAYGEVISATGSTSGFSAADSLITAIYHRFVIFEPRFRDGGSGSATVPNGYTYFTTNFATNNGLGDGLGAGRFVTYPAANQQRIPRIFYSDQEVPDPFPAQNEVGYPISVHADIDKAVTVQSFTLSVRGGTPLQVRLLTHATDAETPTSAAAIIPSSPLAAATTYEAQFAGAIDGVPVSRTWTFTTQ